MPTVINFVGLNERKRGDDGATLIYLHVGNIKPRQCTKVIGHRPNAFEVQVLWSGAASS